MYYIICHYPFGFNAAFGVNGLANSQISNGMTTLDLMAKIGNHSAEHQRDQIINLINAFDRAGIQSYQEDPSLKAQGAKIFSKSTTTASLPPLFSLFKPTEPNPAPSSNIPSGSSGINGAPGHYSTPTSASHGRLNNIGKNTLPPIPSLSSSSVDPKNNDQAYATNVSTHGKQLLLRTTRRFLQILARNRPLVLELILS